RVHPAWGAPEFFALCRRVEETAWRCQRSDLIAEGILDDLDVSCRHRDADRHFVQAELRRFSSRDAEIAVERRDESSGDCVSVYGGDGRTRGLENPEGGRTIVSIPLAALARALPAFNAQPIEPAFDIAKDEESARHWRLSARILEVRHAQTVRQPASWGPQRSVK